jgi:feruloyl esterase
VLAGPQTRDGKPVYIGSAGRPGPGGARLGDVEVRQQRRPRATPIALAYVFQTPPGSPSVMTGQGNTLIDYALGFDVDRDLPKVAPAMDFMAPPDPLMRALRRSGGKLMVFHGAADPVFSALDSIRWHEDSAAPMAPRRSGRHACTSCPA